MELTLGRLFEQLKYDPETGLFTWAESKRWRPRNGLAGCVTEYGYIRICLDKKHHLAHRLAWLYVHGVLPSGQVDHIDGNRTNNAISNLRLATDTQQRRNTKRQVNNTSGFKGVSWSRQKSKWRSCINANGKQRHLGFYDEKDAAHAAYVAAATELFGAFARLT